jgi:hypothetical protein
MYPRRRPASRSTSGVVNGARVQVAETSGRPSVSVPVLSNTATVVRPSSSRRRPERKITCRRAARLIPPINGDRHRQDEGAGGGHHEHGQHATRVAGCQPGGATHRQRERGEPDGVANGEALHRRLALLRVPDELNDPGVLALRRRGSDADDEGSLQVRHAAHHRGAALGEPRHRFAGESGRVDMRPATDNEAVTGNQLTPGARRACLPGRSPPRRPPPRRPG